MNLASPIARYPSVTAVGEPMPTSASPRWVITADGGEWLLKRMADSGPEEISQKDWPGSWALSWAC